jgi:hypothetical protein
MEYRDLVQKWKEYKQYRRKIEPYTDDLDMVKAINHDPPHFFRWFFWIFPLMLGLTLCIMPMFFLWRNLVLFGSLIANFSIEIVWVILGCIGISIAVLSIFQHDRFMIISPEGITIPRFLRRSVFVAWEEIRRTKLRTNSLNTDFKLIILHTAGKVETNLEGYKFPYLRGSGKERRLVQILWIYIRTQFCGQNPVQAQAEVLRKFDKPSSNNTLFLEIVIPLLVTAIAWLLGWIFGLTVFPDLLVSFCILFITLTIMNRPKSYTVLVLAIVLCVVIIILTVVFAPLFPNPLG